MFAKLGRSNALWFFYEKLCRKRTVPFALSLLVLSLGLPILFAWREGVLCSHGSTHIGYLNDFPAICGVGLGLPLISLCVVLYCKRFQNGFQLLHEKQTIQANPEKVASMITYFTEKLNSSHLNWIIPLCLSLNVIWVMVTRSGLRCAWFFSCSDLDLTRPLNFLGWYYAFLTSIVLYAYLSITIYAIGVARLIKKLVQLGNVEIRPIHPDGAGGVAHIGGLGILNAYPIAIVGFSIAAVIYSNKYNFGLLLLDPLHILIILLYLIASVIIFFLPLMYFHNPMGRQKERDLKILSDIYQQKYEILLSGGGDRPKELLGEIESLRAVYNNVSAMPVWPFSIKLMRQYGIAVLTPLWASIVAKIVEIVFSLISRS